MKNKNEIEKKFKFINYIVATMLMIAFALVVNKQFTYIYETNDDFFLMSIISGAYTGTPDAHAIYILYPFAFLLKKLYEVAHEINWYGYSMVGFHYVGLALILGRALELTKENKKKIFTAIIGMALIVSIDLSAIVNAQYTLTAGVLGATAIFFLATSKFEYKNLIKESLIPGVLLLLVLNLRKDIFWVALVFAFLVILAKSYLVICEKGFKNFSKFFQKAGIVIAIFAIFVSGTLFTHYLEYNSVEWKEYTDFNASRTSVYDYNSLPVYSENIEFYEEIGIHSAYELHILQSGNSTLWTEIDNEMMEKIADKSQEIKTWNEQFYNVPIDILNKYFNWIMNGDVITIVILMVLMIILGICVAKKKYWYIVAAFITEITKSGMICYLIYKGRYIERATYPISLLELMILIAILYSVTSRNGNESFAFSKKEKLWKGITYSVLCFSVVLISLVVYRENLHENRSVIDSRAWEPTVTSYFKSNSQNIYFMDGMGTGQLRSPVFGEGSDGSSNRCDMGGWRSKSPIEKAHLAQNDVELCEDALVSKENIYWVQLVSYPEDWLEEFLSDGKMHIEIELYDTIEMLGKVEYNVYKINRMEKK